MRNKFKLARNLASLFALLICWGCDGRGKDANGTGIDRGAKPDQRGGAGVERMDPNNRSAGRRHGDAGGHNLDLSDDEIETRLMKANFVAIPANYQEACRLTLELAKRAPERAMSLIQTMPSGLQILLVQDSVSTYLAGVDEHRLTEWLKPSDDKTRGVIVGLAMDVLAKVAANSPDEALRILAKNTSNSGQMLIANTMLGIAGADPDRALELAKKYLRADQMSTAVASIIDRCASDSPDKAMDMIKLNLSGADAVRGYARVLANVMEASPTLVGGLLDTIPDKSMAGVLSTSGVVEKLLKIDVARTLAALGEVVFTDATKGLYTRMAVGLAGQDSGQALDFVRTLPQGQAANQLVGAVFEVLAKSDCQNALNAVKELDPVSQQSALRAVARTVAAEDFEKAIGLANQSPNDQQQNMYREIARTSAYQNPGNAVKVLEDPVLSQKIGPDFRQEMINATVTTWAKQDLPAAQEWVAALPAADAPKGVQGLMTTWMKTDPVAASQWLSTQPAGPARDAGARVVISQIKDTDPEMAAGWRKTLPPGK